MEPSILIALCWLLFAATHIGLASRRVRPALVARLGPSSFSYLFSFVAIVTFGLLLHVLSLHQHAGAAGLDLGRFTPVGAIGMVTITTGVVLTIVAFQSPPASMLALFIPGGVKEPYGLERVTRHPFFVGTALLGIGHVLLASRMVGVVAFGGLAIYSIAGAMHQDGKLRRELGEHFAAYLDRTSLVRSPRSSRDGSGWSPGSCRLPASLWGCCSRSRCGRCIHRSSPTAALGRSA